MASTAPRRVVLAASVALAGSLLANTTWADEPPALVTDRPGNGNAARLVPASHLQLETSIAYEVADVGSAGRASAPTVLRLGVHQAFELRLGSAILGLDFEDAGAAAHATDSSLGLKLGFLQGGAYELASSIDVALPSGGGAFGSRIVNPEARILSSLPLPAGLGLLLNAGLDVPEDANGERRVRALHVVNISRPLPGIDGDLSLFVESFARHPTDGSGPLWQFDAGAAYLLSPTWQLDLFTQHGLSRAAPELIVSLGVATRCEMGSPITPRRER